MVEGEMGVEWEQMRGVEEFLSDSGFVDNKTNFNPETGEVSYQAVGDEVV